MCCFVEPNCYPSQDAFITYIRVWYLLGTRWRHDSLREDFIQKKQPRALLHAVSLTLIIDEQERLVECDEVNKRILHLSTSCALMGRNEANKRNNGAMNWEKSTSCSNGRSPLCCYECTLLGDRTQTDKFSGLSSKWLLTSPHWIAPMVLKNFVDETSLHGIKYLTRRNWCRRCVHKCRQRIY